MSLADNELRERISALIDGELSAGEADELRARIDRDPGLRDEYESIRRTIEVVRGLRKAKAPPELRGLLRHAPPPRANRLRPWAIGTTLAAAAALLLVVVLDRGSAPSPGGGFREARTDEDPAGERIARPRAEAARESKSVADDGAVPTAVAGTRATGAGKARGQPQEGGVLDQEESESLSRKLEAKETRLAEESRRVAPRPPASAPAGEASRDSGRPQRAARKDPLLAKVESGAPLASRQERSVYFGLLERMGDEDLRAHFKVFLARGRNGFAPTPPRSLSERREAPVAAEGTILHRSEAMRVRALLMRGFPLDRGAERRRKRKEAGATLAANEKELFFDVDATPDDLTQILAWLDSVDDSRLGDAVKLKKAPGGAGSSGEKSGGIAGAGVERSATPGKRDGRRMRVVLRFAE